LHGRAVHGDVTLHLAEQHPAEHRAGHLTQTLPETDAHPSRQGSGHTLSPRSWTRAHLLCTRLVLVNLH
jgi:hypothetical protein